MPIKKTKPAVIRVALRIERRVSAEAAPYRQTIVYETENRNATVASALADINRKGTYRDDAGQPVSEIIWEHSCLQKKCGACAMVIAGKPRLACGAFLRDFAGKGTLTIEPLRKFPVIADLRVDRRIMFENLKTMGLWLEEQLTEEQRTGGSRKQVRRRFDDGYDASRCLQCGCCLEVCPNVAIGEEFFGAAGFIPSARLLSTVENGDYERIRRAYLEHSYAGCGKSLACQKVCPAEIDVTRLLLRTNAAAFRRNPRHGG